MEHSSAMPGRESIARYVVWVLFVVVLGGAAFQVANSFTVLGEPIGAGADGPRLAGAGVLFLGVAGLDVLVRLRSPSRPAMRTMRVVLWVQAFQLMEHLALVLTVFCVGRPTGISTLFGLVAPGPALWTYQAWWLLMVNLAVALLVFRAALQSFRVHAGLLDCVVRGLKHVDLPNAVAKTLRLVCGLAAVVLAGDVVFVVFGANPGNGLVTAFNRLADDLALFFRDLFLLRNQKASFAVNYGLAAAAYVFVGQVIARLPRRARGLRS